MAAPRETGTGTGQLVAGGSSSLERVAAGLTGLGTLALLAGLATLAGLLPVDAAVAGVAVYRLLGAGLAAAGAGLLAVGGLSWADYLETRPDETAGLPVGLGYAVVGLVGGGLVGAQGLGLSLLWPVVALAGAGALGAAAVVPREDVGATLPAGALSLAAGLVVLAGVVDPAWRWDPEAFSITMHGGPTVGLLAAVTGLLVAWTAARAYGGFGPRGKQAGAYLLVSANAAGMLLLLAVVVAFIVLKGLAPLTEGVRIGYFTSPAVWFYVPPIGEYVIVSAPGLWFYWPFVMNAGGLTVDVVGVMPAILGTVWLVAGAVAFAVPLGVGAAVFLTEYAERGRFTRLVELSTNGLWSTPSIVYGLFGLAFLVPRLGNTTSILAGQLVLGFMLLPLVVITSRESLKSVPDEYRDASAALGVGRWETVRSVVLPAAMPGVVTGVILGVGRIAGETAPLLLVTSSGANVIPREGPNVLRSFQFQFAVDGAFPFVHAGLSNPALLRSSSALPYQLYAVITAGVGENMEFAWGTALVLLLVVLSFYAVGIASRSYFRRRLQA